MWACVGTLASSIVSLLLFFSHDFTASPVSLENLGGRALPRPNPYVNLEHALAETKYQFPPIYNFPEVVLQVRTADSARNMYEDDRGWFTRDGSVYPDDRHIIVNSFVSAHLFFWFTRLIECRTPPSHNFASGTLLWNAVF